MFFLFCKLILIDLMLSKLKGLKIMFEKMGSIKACLLVGWLLFF